LETDLVAIVALLALASSCPALTITRTYVEAGQTFPEYGGTAGGAPANAVGGGGLYNVFNAAADWWEMAIADSHTVEAVFGWEPLAGSTLAVSTQYVDPQPPEIGKVAFDNDLSSSFYLDPIPYDNVEFTSYSQYADDLGGGTVNTGRVYTGASGYADGNIDLFSVALHEIGHLLGINGLSHGAIRVTEPLPYAGTRIPMTGDGHIDISTALMYPYTTSSKRTLTSAVDILGAAEPSGFVSVDTAPSFPFILYGDLDDSGYVGQMDLDTVLDKWSQSVSYGNPADPSGDGFVGQIDLDIVLDYWGQSLPPTQGESPPVPEPTTLLLLSLGALAGAGPIRRRQIRRQSTDA